MTKLTPFGDALLGLDQVQRDLLAQALHMTPEEIRSDIDKWTTEGSKPDPDPDYARKRYENACARVTRLETQLATLDQQHHERGDTAEVNIPMSKRNPDRDIDRAVHYNTLRRELCDARRSRNHWATRLTP